MSAPVHESQDCRVERSVRLYLLGVIEHLASLTRQDVRGEGLLEKRNAWLQQTMLEHRLTGIARHIEHFQVAAPRAGEPRNLAAVHPGHHHIGDHQMDLRRKLGDYLQPLGAVPSGWPRLPP